MPLPAALQARLLKRGLLKKEELPEEPPKEEEEEVFAESYDEPNEYNDSSLDDPTSEFDIQIPNCPNRSNMFHECTSYCRKKYGLKKFQPHPVIEKRRIRMLKIYPLPNGWKEVPDVITNRYYYWNMETNQVCWYSPSHPKAKLEYPKKTGQPPSTTTLSSSTKSNTNKVNYMEESIDEIDELLDAYTQEPNSTHAKKSVSNKSPHGQKSSFHTKRQPHKRSNEDPMDPSSYSDVPKGKWSAGMDN